MRSVLQLIVLALALAASPAQAQPSSPPPTPTCLDRLQDIPAADQDSIWENNPIRLSLLDKVRQSGERAAGIRSLLAIEIGLAGSRRIYNSVWLVETPAAVRSLAVETPETEGKPATFTDEAGDADRYALLWNELLDLRVWTTPTDAKTVGLRADVPVFYGTFCRDGRLHRIRIENPPLPTWGKDDTFEQARRRHDKKAREFMLRPRDRAIEVLRLIQAF
jgi:hypothetical protein